MGRAWPVLALLLLAPVGRVAAQGDGGILYAYRPHAGARAEFDAGYRAHLEWHREKADSLPWYGWDVIAGRRMGEFIDGTFGIGFAALDQRVDPAGDAAHAASSFAPHATATARWLVRLRRELSTTMALEDRSPSGMLQVVTYHVSPAQRAAFEDVLNVVRRSAGLAPYAVYECVVGTSDVAYMVVVERSGFGSFDDEDRDPSRAIGGALAGSAVLVVQAESELWRLRRDLTLLPERAGR